MPQLVNASGTYYWGKKNIFIRRGVCEFCHHAADLISYDTDYSLVFVMLPLIPMGKKRILDECPHCTKHRVVKLKKWQEGKAQAFDKAKKMFQDDPHSDETAKAIIGASVHFQDSSLLNALGPELQRCHTQNRGILEGLGSAYSYFSNLEKEEKCFRQALNLGDHPETREKLARNLMDQMRPEEAVPFLSHILESQQTDKIGFLGLLIECFQAQGKHEAALAVINQCFKVYPDLESDKEFRKARKKSEKHLTSGKVIKTDILGLPTRKVKESGLISTLMLRLTGPILLVAILILIGVGIVFSGQNRDVFVVNGLPQSYKVNINGETIGLPAMGFNKITVPEGELSIQVPDSKLGIEPQICTIKTPAWKRLFIDRTFVVNPDRMALLVWEQVEYVAETTDKKDNAAPPEYSFGKLLYEFKGIDFEFQEFPEKMSSSSKRSLYERVGIDRSKSPAKNAMIIALEFGNQEAFQYADRMIETGDDPELYLASLSYVLSATDIIEYLKPKLDQQPVQVDIHRYYIAMMEGVYPDYDLESEYRAMVKRYPQNGDLYYLLAHVILDPAESEKLLIKAINTPQPSAYGYHGLAFLRMANGGFLDALDLEDNALALEPEKTSFEINRNRALWAIGDYNQLQSQLEEQILKSPESIPFRERMVRLLAQKEGWAAAKNYIEKFSSMMARRRGETSGHEICLYLESVAHYAMGDIPAYCETMGKESDGEYLFERAFCQKDFEEAVELLDYYEEIPASEYLLLYMAASQQGETELAENCLKVGVDLLPGIGLEEGLVAEYLAGTTPLDVETALSLMIMPEYKRALMTALGYRFPEHRARFYTMARKLNYERTFPWHFIDEITRES